MNKKRVFMTFINIVVFVLLFLVVTILALCIKGEWTISGYIYSSSMRDVIRVLSILEMIISIVLRNLNKRKITMAILIETNIFTLYKFLDTYFLF